MGHEPGRRRVRGLVVVVVLWSFGGTIALAGPPAGADPGTGRRSNRPLFTVINPPVAASHAFNGLSPMPVNSAVLALNPNDPFDLFAAGNDYNTACPTRQGFYRSLDGGVNWYASDAKCMDPVASYTGCGSPAVAYDFDTSASNKVYVAGVDCSGSSKAIAFQDLTASGWSTPTIAVSPLFAGGVAKEPSMTVDQSPSSPLFKRIYLSSTQVDSPGSNSTITVSFSSDGGTTWFGPVAVDSTQTQPYLDDFGALATSSDGTVYVTWLRCKSVGPNNNCGSTYGTLFVARSSDGGSTWAPPVAIVNVHLPPDANCAGVTAYYGSIPGTCEPFAEVPSIAVDNTGSAYAGRVYVLATRWNGTLEVGVARSPDHGLTWLGPSPVSTVAADQFFPALSVSTKGCPTVSWLQMSGLVYLPYISASTSGGAGGWFGSQALSSAPSDPIDDGFGGHDLGERTGNGWADPTHLFASWMDTSNGSRSEIMVGGATVLVASPC